MCILFSMTTKAAERFSVKKDRSVFKRLGMGNQENIVKNQKQICKYWLQKRCTRNPCKYFHPDQAISNPKHVWKNPETCKSENSPPIEKAQEKIVKNKENSNLNMIVQKTQQKSSTNEVYNGESKSIQKKNRKNSHSDCSEDLNQIVQKSQQKSLTKEVKNDESKSIREEKSKNLHSGSSGDEISMVARMEGHTKGISGIAFPAGSNKLFCGSKDKSLRVWDCNSGQCEAVVDFDEECGTLVNEGEWRFVGLRDMIKGWNLNTQQEVIIRGSGGQVNAITMFEDILFAGMEDGSILSWKSTSETSFSEVATSLKGHNGSVLSLVVGAKKLYSGSTDHTIRVWDCESLECKQVLHGHTGDVTTVLCWDQFLLSGSLDKKIKIWGANEIGTIEEVYQHNVNDGVVAFCGMHDAKGNPILLCSCKHNGVCLYDLPSFMERGRVVSGGDIQAIERGPEGLFFTGDAQGLISVWKLSEESVSKSC